MLLCLDVGNTQIFGGLFDAQNKLVLRFRLSSKSCTSDEFAIALLQVLRENKFDPKKVTKICICSVVPHLDYSLRSACIKYFNTQPFFIDSSINLDLELRYIQARELGADRLANAIAAVDMFPKQNLIILDFGTAITLCAIDANKVYLGGTIFPGLRLLVDSLAKNTAKLPVVDVLAVTDPVATTTVTGIQSGIYFGTLGACREMITQFRQAAFKQQELKIIATGGFAGLFEKTAVYDHLVPDLILQGMLIAAQKNSYWS